MNAFSHSGPLTYVTYRHLFLRSLFPSVAHLPYILLNRHFLPISSLGNHEVLDILAAKSIVEDWANLCKFSPYVQQLKTQDKGNESLLHIQFTDGSHLCLRIMHSLSYLGLTWVDVEAVLDQAIINRGGIKVAESYFYLEYSYLSAVLSRRSVDSEYVYHFSHFPEPIQQQLLRRFKRQYPVKAGSLDELFARTFQHRRRVVSILESLPHNQWRTRLPQLARHYWIRLRMLPLMQRASRFATGIR